MKRIGPLKASEEDIRRRSYLLWEREGRQEGRSSEYWSRAKADLEAEIERMCRAAALAGETVDFVLPRLSISSPPHRTESQKIEVDMPRELAAGIPRRRIAPLDDSNVGQRVIAGRGPHRRSP
jgi:hypothetical protein